MLPFQLTRFKAFILIILFSLLAVACVGGDESDTGSRDATSERSSRLSSSRASVRESTSRGAASTSDAHGAATTSDAHGATAAEPAAPSHGAAAKDAEVHWAYDGDLGPSHWGDLADKFIACKTGTSQSPINISNVIDPQPAQIEFNYSSVPLRILNNGHTIQVNYAPGSSITIDHKEYELLQFHFHTPSEHQLAAHNFPMEGHLVHKNSHDIKTALAYAAELCQENVWKVATGT